MTRNHIPLTDLQPGEAAEVVGIETENSGRLMKLTAYGLVPGAVFTLEQRHPAYVIRVGETRLSLDGAVTAEIMTRPLV